MATTQTRRPPKIVTATPKQLQQYYSIKLAAELGPHNVKRLQELDRDGIVVLDVRSPEGFRKAHVSGAINIPFEEFPTRMQTLPKQKEIITYCWSVTCTLSTKAAYMLASKGYTAREMVGGIEEWQRAGFPIEK